MMVHSSTQEALRTKPNEVNAALNKEFNTYQEAVWPHQDIDKHKLIMLQRLMCAKLQKWQLKRERSAAFDAFLNEEAAAFKAAGIFAEEATVPSSAAVIVNDEEKPELSNNDGTKNDQVDDNNEVINAHPVEIIVANDLLLYREKQEEEQELRELEMELEQEEQLLSERDEEDVETLPEIEGTCADEPVDLNAYRFGTSSAESERDLTNKNFNTSADDVLQNRINEEQEVNADHADSIKSAELEQEESTRIDKNRQEVEDVNRGEMKQEIVALSEREELPHEDHNVYNTSKHLTPINDHEELTETETETETESNKEDAKINEQNRMPINANSQSLTSILSTTSSFAHKPTRNQPAACVIVPLTAEKRKTIVAHRKESILAPLTAIAGNTSEEDRVYSIKSMSATPITAQNANSSTPLSNESKITEKAVLKRPKVSIAPPMDLPSMTITEPISEVVRTALARCRNASVFAELNDTLDTIENDYVTRSHHNKSFHNMEFLLTKEEDERRSLELFEEEEYNQFALQLTTLNAEVQQIYSLVFEWAMADIAKLEEYERHIVESQEQFEQRLLNEQISHAEITENVTRHRRRESTLLSDPLDALGSSINSNNNNNTMGATLSTFASLRAQRCKIFFNNERRNRAQLNYTEEVERNEVYTTIRQFMQLLRSYENEIECISLQEATFREPIETEYAKWIANVTRIHGSFILNQLTSEESNKRLDIIQNEFDHHQRIFDRYILERMVVERTSQLNALETRGRNRIADVALKTMAFLHDALLAQHTGMMDVIRKEAERRVEVCEQEVNSRAALEQTYLNTMEVICGNEDDLTSTTAVYRTQFKQDARKSISMYHLHDENMTSDNTMNGVKEDNQDETVNERLIDFNNQKNSKSNSDDNDGDMFMLMQMEHIHRSRCMKQERVAFHFIYTSHCRGVMEAVEESENEQRDEIESEEEVQRKMLHKQEQRAVKTAERATKLKEDYVKLNRTYSMRAKLPLSQGNLQAKIIELNKSETRTRERIVVAEHSYRVAMNDERRADRRKSVFGCSIVDLDWNRNAEEINSNEITPDANSKEHEQSSNGIVHNRYNSNNNNNNNMISFHAPFFQPRANRRGSHSVGGTSVVSFSDFIDKNMESSPYSNRSPRKDNNNSSAQEEDKKNAVDHVGETHDTAIHEGKWDANGNMKQTHDGNNLESNTNKPKARPSYIVGPDGQSYNAEDAPLPLQTATDKSRLQTSSILQSSLFRRSSMRPYKSQSQMFDSAHTFTALSPPSESNSFMYSPHNAKQINQEGTDKPDIKTVEDEAEFNKVEKEKEESAPKQTDRNNDRSKASSKKQPQHHRNNNNNSNSSSTKNNDAEEDDEEDEKNASTLNENADKAHSKLFARQQSFVKTIVVFSEKFRRGMSFSSVNSSVNRDHLENSNMQLLLEEEEEEEEQEKERKEQQNVDKIGEEQQEFYQPGEEYLKVISIATELDANGNTLVCSTAEAATLMKQIIVICFNLTLEDTYKMRLRDFYRCCNTMSVRRTELSEETIMSNQNAEYVPQLSSLTLWSSKEFMENLQKYLVEAINTRRSESSRPCSAEQMEIKPHEAELNMTNHSLYNNSSSNKKPLEKNEQKQKHTDIMTLEELHASRREWVTLDDLCKALTLTLVKLHWQEDLQNKEFSSTENSDSNASMSPVELKGSYTTDELVVTRKLVEYWTWSFLADGVKSLIEEYTRPCSMQLQSLFDMFSNLQSVPDRMPYELFERFFMKDHNKRFLQQLDEVEKELPYDLHSDNIVKLGVPFVCFASFIRASFRYLSLPSLYGVGNTIITNNDVNSINDNSNNMTCVNDQNNANAKESSVNENTAQPKFMSMLQKVSEKLLTPCGIHHPHRLSIINHGCAALTVLNRSYAEFIYFCGTRRRVSKSKDFYQCSEGVARKYLHGLLKTMNECKMEIIGSKYILLLILMSIWMETACQSKNSASITSLNAIKADTSVESDLDKETRRFEAEVLRLAESFYSITTQKDISRRALRKACVEVMLSFYVLFVTASSVLPLSSQRAHYAAWFKEFLNCLRREQRKLPSLEQVKDLQEKNEYSNNSSADWSFLTMMHRSVNTHWFSYNANIDALLHFYALLDQKCKADEQLQEEVQKKQQQQHDNSTGNNISKERSHSAKKKEKIDTSLRADMYKLSRVHKHRTVVNVNSTNDNENDNLQKQGENVAKEGKAGSSSTTKSEAKRGVRREKTDAEKAAELEGVANFIKTYNLATDTCCMFINAHWTAVKWLRCYVTIATMPTQQTDYTKSQVATPKSVVEALIQQSDCLLALEQMYTSSLTDGSAEEPLLFYQVDPWRIRYGEHIETCIFHEEKEEDTNKTTPTFVKRHVDVNDASKNNELLSDLSTIVATATVTGGGALKNVINVEPPKRYDRRHVQKVKEWQLQQEQTQVNQENQKEEEQEQQEEWSNFQQMENKSEQPSKQPKDVEQRRRKYSLLPLRVPERPTLNNKKKSIVLASSDTFLPLKSGKMTMSNFQICKESNGSVIGKTIELFRELKRHNDNDDDDDDNNENDDHGDTQNTEETEIHHEQQQQRHSQEHQSVGKVSSNEECLAQSPTFQNNKMTCEGVGENDDSGEHFLPQLEDKHIQSSSETSQNKRFVVPRAIKERKTYNQDKFTMSNVSNGEYDDIDNVSRSRYASESVVQENATKEMELPTLLHDSKEDKRSEKENVEGATNGQKHFTPIPLQENLLTAQGSNSHLTEERKVRRNQNTSMDENRKHKRKTKSKSKSKGEKSNLCNIVSNINSLTNNNNAMEQKVKHKSKDSSFMNSKHPSNSFL